MAKLHNEDVLKLAQLARLKLSEAEIEQFRNEINNILSYVEMLQEVDIDGVKPTSQVTGLTNKTRADKIVATTLKRADLLKNVPELTDEGYIKVKRVLS